MITYLKALALQTAVRVTLCNIYSPYVWFSGQSSSKISRLSVISIKNLVPKNIFPTTISLSTRCHLPSILIIFLRDATQNSLFIILKVHSTCFGCQPHPSSGAHKTVTTASGADQVWPRWREVAAVPKDVVTVFCTPDDGCSWHPKHAEWTCRIINRLLCVASSWAIINIKLLLRITKYSVTFYWIVMGFVQAPRSCCSFSDTDVLRTAFGLFVGVLKISQGTTRLSSSSSRRAVW